MPTSTAGNSLSRNRLHRRLLRAALMAAAVCAAFVIAPMIRPHDGAPDDSASSPSGQPATSIGGNAASPSTADGGDASAVIPAQVVDALLADLRALAEPEMVIDGQPLSYYIAQLDNTEQTAIAGAMLAIQHFDEQGAGAIPRLHAMVMDPQVDERLRYEAARTLVQMRFTPADQVLTASVVRLASDADQPRRLRESLLDSLAEVAARYAPSAIAHRRLLLELLSRDDDEPIQPAAVRLCAQLEGEEIVDHLVGYARKRGEGARFLVATALLRADGLVLGETDNPRVVAAAHLLLEASTDASADDHDRALAMQVLGQTQGGAVDELRVRAIETNLAQQTIGPELALALIGAVRNDDPLSQVQRLARIVEHEGVDRPARENAMEQFRYLRRPETAATMKRWLAADQQANLPVDSPAELFEHTIPMIIAQLGVDEANAALQAFAQRGDDQADAVFLYAAAREPLRPAAEATIARALASRDVQVRDRAAQLATGDPALARAGEAVVIETVAACQPWDQGDRYHSGYERQLAVLLQSRSDEAMAAVCMFVETNLEGDAATYYTSAVLDQLRQLPADVLLPRIPDAFFAQLVRAEARLIVDRARALHVHLGLPLAQLAHDGRTLSLVRNTPEQVAAVRRADDWGDRIIVDRRARPGQVRVRGDQIDTPADVVMLNAAGVVDAIGSIDPAEPESLVTSTGEVRWLLFMQPGAARAWFRIGEPAGVDMTMLEALH